MLRPSGHRCALLAAVLAVGVTCLPALAAGPSSQAQALHTALTSKVQRACVWQPLPSADPHAVLYDRFDSVAAVSPREAWAVGDYYTGREGGPSGAFIERWNGRRWKVAAPMLPGAILWSVSASGARDVWAVGQSGAGRQLIDAGASRSRQAGDARTGGACARGRLVARSAVPHDDFVHALRQHRGHDMWDRCLFVEAWNDGRDDDRAARRVPRCVALVRKPVHKLQRSTQLAQVADGLSDSSAARNS